MKVSKFPNLKLYHGGTSLRNGAAGPVRICSYLPIEAVDKFFRNKCAMGEIEHFSIYQVDPKLAAHKELDDGWQFLDKNNQLQDLETLYIRQLAGI